MPNPASSQPHATGSSRPLRSDALAEDDRLTITWRGVLVGAVTVVAWFYYLILFMGINLSSSTFVLSQYPMVAVIPFVLWLFFNVLLKRVWPRVALSRGELLTVFSMTWIVGALPMWGWSDYWVAVLGAPSFMPTAENQWETLFLGYMPWHALPGPSPRVIDPLWLGLPQGAPLPWDAWIGVLARWVGASLAMVVFGLCLMVLFYRQWVDNEKLSFPLAQMPLDLTRGFDGPRRMPDLFRSTLFWAGFGLVFLPLLYNIGTYFIPGVPLVEIYRESYIITLPQPFPALTVRILPLVLALTYLCPLDILGSLILFYLLAVVKIGVMDQFGFSVGASGQRLISTDILHLESFGAIVLIAIWSVWLARGHLGQVWRQASSGTGDPAQVRLYRLALVGLVLSAAYVIAFGVSLGAHLPLAAGTFLLMAMTFFVTVKLIAATGFPYLMPSWPNMKGGSFITELIGSANLSTKNVVAFKLFTSQAFFGNIRLPAWPAIPHHLRIFSLSRQRFRVCAVVLIAFTVGCLVAAWASIEVAYDQGGAVHLVHAFNVYPQIVNLLQQPREFDVGKWGVWVAGLSEAGALAFLRGRFHWFPLHPLGVAFQYAPGPNIYWFSLLLVWIVKATALRYGGVQAYQRGKPLFFGLGLGYAAAVALSMVVDAIWFPDEGHRVHYW